MAKGSNQRKRTRGTDGESIRPWTAVVTARQPDCHECTWVPSGGKWKLKFVNRACGKHGRLA